MSFSEDPEGIVYTERVAVWLRVLVGSLGIMGMFIPYPFLVYNNWRELSLGTLVAIFGIAFPLLVSAAFIAIALAPSRRLEFDRTRRSIHYNYSGPFYRGRAAIDFASVTDVTVGMRESDDGPYPVLKMHFAGRRPFEVGTFDKRDQAEAWRERILALTKPAPAQR